MAKKNVQISVIVPNYNGAGTISTCIQSILNNDYKNFELIIIDDCSEDSSVSIIKSFKDLRIKFLRNKKNLGPSKTRNCGIKTSQGGIILLIDSDTYIPKDCISKHLSTHQSIKTDIVAGSVKGVHKTVIGQADDFCNWWTSIPLSKSRVITKFHVPTTNLSIKRNVFDSIGYFKEELRGGEDSEFSHRAINNGLRIYFDTSITSYHFDRDSLKSFLKHNYTWGLHLVSNRVPNKLEYNWLLPKNYLTSWLYIPPLAFLFTGFITYRWFMFKPQIIAYTPLIFLGKIAQAVGIKDSLRNRTKK